MRLLISGCFLLALVGAASAQATGPGVSGAIPNGVQRKAPVMGSGGGAGGTNGQLQYNSGGALAGTGGGGDCTFLGPSTFTCTKTNGVAFGPLATSTRASFLTGPFTSLTTTGPVTIAPSAPSGGTNTINNVSVNGKVNALDFSGSDIGQQINNAVTWLENNAQGFGTIYIPRGTYNMATPVPLGKAGCNITVEGDSKGGTIFNVSSPTNNGQDLFSMIDSTNEAPPICRGGFKDFFIIVQGASTPPDNFNAIHFSNVVDAYISNVMTWNLNGASQDDSAVYIDPGVSNVGGTFIENIFIDHLYSYYSSYMITFDGKSYSQTSLNNNQITQSHCDVAGPGACIYYKNVELGAMLNTYLEFNGDIGVSGGAAMRANLSPSNINNAYYNVRMQYFPVTGHGFLFDSPVTGVWNVNGNASCAGNTTCYNASHDNQVLYNVVPSHDAVTPPMLTLNTQTDNNGNPHAVILDIQNPAGSDSTNLAFAHSNDVGWDWIFGAGYFGGGAQGNICLTDGQNGFNAWCVTPTVDAVVAPIVQANNVATATAYGAVGDAIFSGDGKHASDGTTNGTTTFTSPSGGFTSAMVGVDIFIQGAGTAGALYLATVSHVTNATTLTMSSTPPTNISGTASYVIGHDNTAALQQWLNALRQTTTNGVNNQAVNTIEGYLPAGVYMHRGLNFGGAVGIKITGAGSTVPSGGNITNGSNFLCIDPVTSPNGCHDFTGAGGDTIRDVSFLNGSNIGPGDQTAGIWNMMLARHPTAGFAILSKFQNVTFHSSGTYNVIIDNSEQNSWIDDDFNSNGDPAIAIYLTTTTSTFTSPFYGSLVGAGVSATENRFEGGACQISSNSNGLGSGVNAVTLDGSPGDITFRDCYVRLQNARDNFVGDSANGATPFSMSFDNMRIEPDQNDTANPTNALLDFAHGGSSWNGGELHNVSWGSLQTNGGPIISVAGSIDAVHASNLIVSPGLPNPEVVMGGGTDNYFGNINGTFIQYNGSAIATQNTTHPFIGGTVSSFGDAVDALDYILLNGFAGSNSWAWYSSGTGTGAPWGAGGMGWNYGSGGGTSAGGFTSNGTFIDSKIKANHYGCAGGTPTITGGGTISGCDAQGEVVTSVFPVTLTFASAYGSNVSCSLTDDGQPNFWYVSSKASTGFTLNCSTLSGGGCSGTQFVTYNCAGQGAP